MHPQVEQLAAIAAQEKVAGAGLSRLLGLVNLSNT